MEYIKLYKTEELYQNDLENNLNKLDNYLVYIENNNKVNLKNKFIFYYSVSDYLINNVQPTYNGKLPLISRCDLFKTIKINGKEIDLSDKIREPHIFTETGNNLTFELGSLILSNDNSFNEKFVLSKTFTKPEKGIIELELNDNVTTLLGGFMLDLCITSIDEKIFDNIDSNSAMSLFATCSNLDVLNLNYFDTTKVTNMFSMFGNCNNLTKILVTKFDTSNVIDMNSMFMSCNSLINLDLTHFNTSNVTNMYSMFLNCKKLESLDLSSFDTSKVTDMENMFSGCVSLKELKLNNFSINNIIDSNNMFNKCDSLNEITCSQEFKDWCIAHQAEINLPISMRERGDGKWNII